MGKERKEDKKQPQFPPLEIQGPEFERTLEEGLSGEVVGPLLMDDGRRLYQNALTRLGCNHEDIERVSESLGNGSDYLKSHALQAAYASIKGASQLEHNRVKASRSARRNGS